VTITLSVIGSRGVTLTVSRSALEQAPPGVAIGLARHDGPFILTLTRDEARAFAAELNYQLAETGEVS